MIPGIEYDYDKATLRPQSKLILDQLADFFSLNNDINVEIRSHTDDRGSDVYNQKLSQERAAAVRFLLIKNGVDGKQLIAIGMGQERPIADNGTDVGRQQNRRVELTIVPNG